MLLIQEVFLSDCTSNAFQIRPHGKNGDTTDIQPAKYTLVVLAQGEDILCTVLDVRLEIDGYASHRSTWFLEELLFLY